MILIETQRLILRTWAKADAAPYYHINQDPKVTEFLWGALTTEQIEDFITAANQHQEQYGYTLWATELKECGKLIGFIGLNNVPWQAHFTPTVEIGWRLGSFYWGKGYATEGAKAALAYGFNTIGLQEIVSFTVPNNKGSIRVMEKIGLKHDIQGDFVHPKLDLGHRLSQHILYRLTREDYLHRR